MPIQKSPNLQFARTGGHLKISKLRCTTSCADLSLYEVSLRSDCPSSRFRPDKFRTKKERKKEIKKEIKKSRNQEKKYLRLLRQHMKLMISKNKLI